MTLVSAVRVSTHFRSKQARKTVAARHISGNSHGPTGFAVRPFPETPNTKTRDSQTEQNALVLFCNHYDLLCCILHIKRLKGKDKYLLQLWFFFLCGHIQKLFQGTVVLLCFFLIFLFLSLKKRTKKTIKLLQVTPI